MKTTFILALLIASTASAHAKVADKEGFLQITPRTRLVMITKQASAYFYFNQKDEKNLLKEISDDCQSRSGSVVGSNSCINLVNAEDPDDLLCTQMCKITAPK